MNIKKVLFTAALALGIMSASAQEQQTIEVFNPHWYIQLQGGAQYTLGERDFSDLISPNAQVTVGYNFNPIIGARLSVNAWQSKAGSTIENIEYAWKWKYVAPSVDVTVNLSNLVCGYKANRIFNLGIFAGLGANIAFDNDEAVNVNNRLNALYPGYVRPSADQWLRYIWDGTKVRLNGRAGLTADFRVSDRVAVGLEAQANIVSDHYNSKKAPNSDFYFNALAGVKIALGPTYSTKFIPAPEPQIEYVEKIVEKVVEAPCPEPVIEPIRRDVFFVINKSVIRDSEEQKVKDIVDYMRQNQTAKVMVTGYADAGTGNDKINDRLAAQRADAVVKMLTQKYGIPADRISYDSKGARVQPFADNDSNRVSICIAEVQK